MRTSRGDFAVPATRTADRSVATSPLAARDAGPGKDPQAADPQAEALQQAERTKESATAWQRLVPGTTSSYQAYYHRGVLPGGNNEVNQSPATPPAATDRDFATNVAPNDSSARSAEPAAPALAPLIDGDSYRRQLRAARIPVSSQKPVTPGSWLAAYQELYAEQDRDASAAQAPTTPSANRSLQSAQ